MCTSDAIILFAAYIRHTMAPENGCSLLKLALAQIKTTTSTTDTYVDAVGCNSPRISVGALLLLVALRVLQYA